MRRTLGQIEDTVGSQKKKVEAIDVNKYLLIEDFAVFTEGKLPDILQETESKIMNQLNKGL